MEKAQFRVQQQEVSLDNAVGKQTLDEALCMALQSCRMCCATSKQE